MKKYIIAQNYMCFLALVEMILYDIYGYSILTQYDMAEAFGITVPLSAIVPISNIKRSTVIKDYGIHIDESTLNNFFRQVGLDVYVSYYKENPYEYNSIDEYSNKKYRNNKYLIYTFSYGYLYRDFSKYDIGHAVLYEEILSQEKLKIYDPGPDNHGIKTVNRSDLHEAMIYRSGGIYCFSNSAKKISDGGVNV